MKPLHFQQINPFFSTFQSAFKSHSTTNQRRSRSEFLVEKEMKERILVHKTAQMNFSCHCSEGSIHMSKSTNQFSSNFVSPLKRHCDTHGVENPNGGPMALRRSAICRSRTDAVWLERWKGRWRFEGRNRLTQKMETAISKRKGSAKFKY